MADSESSSDRAPNVPLRASVRVLETHYLELVRLILGRDLTSVKISENSLEFPHKVTD
jgi:hypothetical protein